jgi:hypothetical protein
MNTFTNEDKFASLRCYEKLALLREYDIVGALRQIPLTSLINIFVATVVVSLKHQ